MKSELSIIELIFKCLSASPPLKSTKAILVINKLSSIPKLFPGSIANPISHKTRSHSSVELIIELFFFKTSLKSQSI